MWQFRGRSRSGRPARRARRCCRPGPTTKVWRPGPTGLGSSTGTPRSRSSATARVEVGHPQGEVLAERRWGRGLDQVQLADTEVDPGPAEPEVRPVAADRPAEHLGVEGDGGGDVGDVDRDVVDGERLHAPSLPGPRDGVTRLRGPSAGPDAATGEPAVDAPGPGRRRRPGPGCPGCRTAVHGSGDAAATSWSSRTGRAGSTGSARRP